MTLNALMKYIPRHSVISSWIRQKKKKPKMNPLGPLVQISWAFEYLGTFDIFSHIPYIEYIEMYRKAMAPLQVTHISEVICQ